VKKIFHLPSKKDTRERFTTLLRPHLDGLYQLAYRFSQNRDDAEDLVQDLLIKVYPRLEEMESIENLKSWLATVLRHIFLDNLRRYKRSPIHLATEDDAVLASISSSTDGPAQISELSKEINKIQDALMQLSEDQRVLLVMHDMEGYKLIELESMLEVPIGTLKSRIHRARARLREILGT